MKIKWLGHSSFLVTSNSGLKIVTDPYTPGGKLSYGAIQETADIVTISHQHFDHNNIKAILGKPEVITGTGVKQVKNIAFKGISAYHDESKGHQRGENVIYCFTVDGIKLCHLGDLGHELDQAQIREVGETDILMIPVGGFFTTDAATASRVSRNISPKVIIPMHYKTPKCDLPISGVDEFLKGKSKVRRVDSSEIVFQAGQLPSVAEVVVLRHAL